MIIPWATRRSIAPEPSTSAGVQARITPSSWAAAWLESPRKTTVTDFDNRYPENGDSQAVRVVPGPATAPATRNMEAGRAPQPARPNQCQAMVASTGRRCSKGGMPDGYCATHSPDPNVRANMQLARRLGGARPRQQ